MDNDKLNLEWIPAAYVANNSKQKGKEAGNKNTSDLLIVKSLSLYADKAKRIKRTYNK